MSGAFKPDMAPRRSSEQRVVDNARFSDRLAEAGIVKVNVTVPVDRLPELRAIALAWRHKAKRMLEADWPSADQILRIHGLCRALRIRLPVRAFDTRSTAEAWLSAHEQMPGAVQARPPV